MMGSATLLVLSLSQLFSNQNETTFIFGQPDKNSEVQMRDKRMTFFLQTPNYPQNYGKNLDLTMHFKFPSSNDTTSRHTLFLSCYDGFRLQNRPGGSRMMMSVAQCTDFFHFNELTTCGDDLSPENIQHIIYGPIKQNGVIFRFKSDSISSPDDVGFRCRAIIDQKKSCSQYIQLDFPNNAAESISGIKLKRMEGGIINCAHNIQVPHGFSVHLVFIEFNLDPSDGEYCLTVGNNPSNSFCSDAKEGKNRWPPKELIVEPTNGVLNINLMSYDLEISRSINTDRASFVIDVSLHRGQEQAGSAKHFIFPDPTLNAKAVRVEDNFAPKPPQPNRIYRQAMIPIPSPGPDDTCMCWDFPSDNLFMSLMAMGQKSQKS